MEPFNEGMDSSVRLRGEHTSARRDSGGSDVIQVPKLPFWCILRRNFNASFCKAPKGILESALGSSEYWRVTDIRQMSIRVRLYWGRA